MFSPKILVFLGLLAGSALSHSSVPPRVLVPVSKRSNSLQARSVAEASLSPKSFLDISFGENSSDGDKRYVADLKLHGYPELPLLALEEFENLVDRISCEEGSINIDFLELNDAQRAYLAWKAARTFVLVSSHPHDGCNLPDERAAHRITASSLDPNTGSIKLTSTPIEWADAGSRMSLEFRHVKPDVYERQLVRRQQSNETEAEEEDGFIERTTFDLTAGNATDRMQMWPPQTSPSDLKPRAPQGQTPGLEILAAVPLEVHCVGCRTVGKAAIEAALDFDTDLLRKRADKDTEEKKEFKILEVDTAYFSVELEEQLKAIANLEFFVGGEFTQEIKQSVFPPIILSPFQLGGIIGIGPKFDFEIIANIQAGGVGCNFTYGAELTVPANASAFLDYSSPNGTKSRATGWDAMEVKEIPFKLNALGDDLSVTLNITARPSLTFGIFALGGIAGGVSAGLELDAPKVFTTATLVKEVSNTCTELADDEYEYHPFALNVTSGISVGLFAAAETDINFGNKIPDIFNQEYKKTLFEKSWPFTPKCFAFDSKTLGTVVPAEATAMLVDQKKLERVTQEKGAEAAKGVEGTVLIQGGADQDEDSGAGAVGARPYLWLLVVSLCLSLYF